MTRYGPALLSLGIALGAVVGYFSKGLELSSRVLGWVSLADRDASRAFA